jgi:Peptidase C13 family
MSAERRVTKPRRHEGKLGLIVFRVFVSSWLALAAFSGSAAAQQTHVLVVTGVAGDEEHAKKFQEWAKTFIDAARSKEGVPDANIIYLSDRAATKAGVEKAFADIAARVKPNDEVFVLLIGHGSFDGTVAAFNLMGPDLTAEEYAKLLSKFTAQRIVFVNTSSASGAFLKPLAGPGRVIVTATKTGGERNDTDFPEYFVAAFGDAAADRDRNGHVSVGEAFDYAKTKVTQAFQQKGLLLTEHATLEDGGEGRLASAVFLGGASSTSAPQVDTSDPAMRALVEQRDAIDKQIADLRARKASMPEAQYEAEMEKLLTQLAVKTREIRELQAKKK